MIKLFKKERLIKVVSVYMITSFFLQAFLPLIPFVKLTVNAQDSLTEPTSYPVPQEDSIVMESKILNGNTETFENIVENQQYIYSLNNKVSIKFIRLPEGSNSFSIESKDIQVEGQSIAGYEFLSSMENGTFEYEMTLPNHFGDNAVVKYTENGDTFNDLNSLFEDSSVVKFNADHFTVFVVVPDDIVSRSFFNPNVQGWSLVKSGNANYSLASVNASGIPNTFGSHVIKLDRVGVTGTENRSYLGYYETNKKLNSIEDIKWNVYSKTGTDTYLNIYLRKNLDTASVVFSPSITQGTWKENSLSTASSITVRHQKFLNGTTVTNYSSWAELLASQYGSWDLRVDNSSLAGIVIVSGSTGNGGAQEHYIDGITVDFVGEEAKYFDFVNQLPVEPTVEVVKINDLKGWVVNTRVNDLPGSVGSGAEANFIESNDSPLPGGALELTTINSNDSRVRVLKNIEIPLSELEFLSFDSKQVTGPLGSANVSLRLGLDNDGDGSIDQSIVYETYYNGTNLNNTWQTWNALNGKFWGVWNGGGGYDSNKTLNEIPGITGNTVIRSVSLGLGNWNPAWNIVVDNLRVNNTIYDFENYIDTEAPVVNFLGFRDQSNSSYNSTQAIKSCGAYNRTGFIAWEWELSNNEFFPVTYTYKITEGPTAVGWSTTTTNTHHNGEIPQEGNYIVEIYATDQAGNISEKVSCEVTFDKTRPLVELVNPSSPVTGSYVYTLNATDETQLSKIVGNIYQGATLVKSTSSSVSGLNGSHNVDISSLLDGSYKLKYNSHDMAGNVSTTYEFEFIVDNTAPSIPLNGVPHNTIINTNNFYFSWDDSTDDNGSIIYEFQSSMSSNNSNGILDTSVWKNTSSSHPEQNPLNIPKILSFGAPDGTWYWQVRAIDALGNTSDWSEIWNVTIDTVSPEAPIILLPNEAEYINSMPILNDWTDVVDASGIDYYEVEYVYDDGHTFSGGPYRTTTISERNHVPSSAEQGGVQFRVRAYDNAGNVGDWSEWRHYYYDITKPSTGIETPNENVYENTGIYISGTTIDNSGVDEVYLEYSIAGENNWNLITTLTNSNKDTPFNWSYIWTPSSEGTFDIKAWAKDIAGNIESTDYVYNITFDQSAPVVEITNPLNNATVNGIVDVRGSVQDDNLWRYYYVIFNANGNVVSKTVYKDTGFTDELIYSWDTSLVADGIYFIRLEARDKADNKNSNSIDTIQVEVNNFGTVQGMKLIPNLEATGENDLFIPDSGWTIVLRTHDASIVEYATTDENGEFKFNVVESGNYYLCEEVKTGWFQISPNEMTPNTVQNGDEEYCYNFSVGIGESVERDFINSEYSTINVYKNLLDRNDSPVSSSQEFTVYLEEVLVDFEEIDEDLPVESNTGIISDNGEDSMNAEFIIKPGIFRVLEDSVEGFENLQCRAVNDEVNYRLTAEEVNLPEGSFIVLPGQTVNVECTNKIVNLLPQVTISASPAENTVQGTNITLTANGSGGDGVLGYSWVCSTGEAGSSQQLTLSNVGTHNCTVTVSDVDNDSSTASGTYTISVVSTPQQNPNPQNPNGNNQGGVGGTGTIAGVSNTVTTQTEDNEADVLGATQQVCTIRSEVSGFIFNDKNNNDKKDNGENGINGVKVTLLTTVTNDEGEKEIIEVMNVRTNQEGLWKAQLCPGEYRIMVDRNDLPEGSELEDNNRILEVDEDKDVENIDFAIQGIETSMVETSFNWWIILLLFLIPMGLIGGGLLYNRSRRNNAL